MLALSPNGTLFRHTTISALRSHSGRSLQKGRKVCAMIQLLVIISWFANVLCAPNWSVFDVIDTLNVSQCVDLVSAIPVNKYWDTEKAEFRVGFLGDMVKTIRPEFVTSVSKSRYVNNKLESQTVSLVDSAALFTYMICASHFAADLSASIEAELADFQSEKSDFALKIIRIASELGVEWRTASEVRAAREIVSSRVDLVNRQLNSAISQQALREENLKIKNEVSANILIEAHHGRWTNFVYQKRRAIRDDHHNKILELRKEHQQYLYSLQVH